MPAPLAYLITWTTYGSWLPGDARGWVRRGAANTDQHEPANIPLELSAKSSRSHAPVILTDRARLIVAQTIEEHVAYRRWVSHACNARTNHVHVVVSAPVPPEKVMAELKAWCTRRLREQGVVGPEQRVWTAHGSTRYLKSEASVARAIEYVAHEQ